MVKYKITKRKKRKKKRTSSMYTQLTGKPLTSTTETGEVRKFSFKSGSGASRKKQNEKAKTKMMELADCLVDISSEWTTFDEGQKDTLKCLEDLSIEGKRNKKLRMEVRRAELNMTRIDTLAILVSYVYQLKLKLEGLSVNAILLKQ